MGKVIAALVALAALCAGTWWFAFRGDASYQPYVDQYVPGQSQPPAATQMPTADAQRILAGVGSPDRKQQGGVMTPQLRKAFLAQSKPMFTQTSVIGIVPATFRSSGNVARIDMNVTVSGGSAQTYVLILVRTDPTQPWLIANTQEGK